jgi:hypothetical protein
MSTDLGVSTLCSIATDKVRLDVFGLVDGKLCGEVQVLHHRGNPLIQVWEGHRHLGNAVMKKASAGAKTSWGYDFPAALFDGKPHAIHVRFGDASVRFDFIGERAAGKLAVPPQSAAEASITVPEPGTSRPTAPAQTSSALRAKADALRKDAQLLQSLLAENGAPAKHAPRRPPIDLQARYGSLYPEALRKRPGGQDFVWLGVIRYEYRHQRPQHLIEQLADRGHRVFYIAMKFDAADERGRFQIISNPHNGVYLVQLRVSGVPPKNIYGGFSDAQIDEIRASLDEAMLALDITAPSVVVQYPSWHPIASAVPGATVVQDCLDFVGGFDNVPPHVVELEAELVREADVVITTSGPLDQHVAPIRKTTVIRNAADVDFFAQAVDFEKSITGARPVIGYFGAISEWYRVGWVEYCAKKHPEWDFVLIGEVRGADVACIKELPNVQLLGEQPYKTLPSHLEKFDVAIIPFKLNELIMCTNPVKMYEYMAAGKAVVASAMPEAVSATPLIYIADDRQHFAAQIAKALAEDSPDLRKQRHEWAKAHTWDERAGRFMDAIAQATPLVSVVILAYNNWTFTNACVHSVLTLSDYSNLEVIVVDNASTDETATQMRRIASADSRIKYIRNEQNLGFAAGNNVGLKAAAGHYVILLNNDTYVTKGWVRDLIRPLALSSSTGLCGPLTNNIGNEQKVRIDYADMHDMERKTRRFTRMHLRKRYKVKNLAFFCVAIRRDVLEKVGYLDESYGLGFFEDDDYCQRVLSAGYEIVVADDVFVHHHLSASFNALGQEQKRAQMLKNKAIFEERWGPWKPHKYRDAPGFG